MPRGRVLARRDKEAIYSCYFLQKKTVPQVFLEVFQGNTELIAYRHLFDLCKFLDHASDLEVEMFLNKEDGRKLFAGRKPKLDPEKTSLLLTLLASNRRQNLTEVRDSFVRLWFEDIHSVQAALSPTSVCCELKREKWSYRILETRNMLQNTEEQLIYLERIRHVHPSRIIDIDGMSQSRKDFKAKYGWAPSDDEEKWMQITIHNRTFAVHAAYSELGFVAWEIFEGAVTQNEITHFVNERLAPFVKADSFLIIDNAANQRTAAVRAVIEAVFLGKYLYSPAYTPELKPVERGFSNVKHWIRKYDSPEAAADPVGLIQRAFELYSVRGALGHTAYNHFSLYRRIYDAWLQEL